MARGGAAAAAAPQKNVLELECSWAGGRAAPPRPVRRAAVQPCSAQRSSGASSSCSSRPGPPRRTRPRARARHTAGRTTLHYTTLLYSTPHSALLHTLCPHHSLQLELHLHLLKHSGLDAQKTNNFQLIRLQIDIQITSFRY